MFWSKGTDDDDDLPTPPPEPKGPCPAGGEHNFQLERGTHIMACQNNGCNASYNVG